MRVLIVDDSAEVVEVLVDGLRSYGHTVDGVCTANEAVRAVQASPPDVVILDLSLHECDGWALAKRLRPHCGANPPRFFALSGLDDDADRARSLAEGFEDHLIKPVRIARLDEILRRAR